MNFKLAFIGFGTVGQGLAEILLEKKEMLAKNYNFNWTVVAISDTMKGSVYEKNGLDMVKVLDIIKNGKKLDEYPTGLKGWNSLKTINDSNADTIIEVTFTDVKTGEPAITHIEAALNIGKNVVSTNKGPVVKKIGSLIQLAKKIMLFMDLKELF